MIKIANKNTFGKMLNLIDHPIDELFRYTVVDKLYMCEVEYWYDGLTVWDIGSVQDIIIKPTNLFNYPEANTPYTPKSVYGKVRVQS